MADMYQDFLEKKQRLENHQTLKKRDRLKKTQSKLKHHTSDRLVSEPATDEYREAYERIFGHK